MCRRVCVCTGGHKQSQTDRERRGEERRGEERRGEVNGGEGRGGGDRREQGRREERRGEGRRGEEEEKRRGEDCKPDSGREGGAVPPRTSRQGSAAEGPELLAGRVESCAGFCQSHSVGAGAGTAVEAPARPTAAVEGQAAESPQRLRGGTSAGGS